MKEMVGGCCVCSDERGWSENPLVYCDGQGCNVAVHQACYGILTVPSGPWFCRKCESQERTARVRCEMCPLKEGALKRTDTGGWCHVVCALFIPEAWFGNVQTMEPIILKGLPPERFNKVCYICEENNRASKATTGACMQCNKNGCKFHFHVTCAQQKGLLCEEAGTYMDNVKYCGYCSYHYKKLKKDSHIKVIPAFKPIQAENLTPEPTPEKPVLSKGDKVAKGASSSAANQTLTMPRTAKMLALIAEVREGKEKAKAAAASSSSTSPSAAQVPSNNASNSSSSDSEPYRSPSSKGDKITDIKATGKFTTANFTETTITPSPANFADLAHEGKGGKGEKKKGKASRTSEPKEAAPSGDKKYATDSGLGSSISSDSGESDKTAELGKPSNGDSKGDDGMPLLSKTQPLPPAPSKASEPESMAAYSNTYENFLNKNFPNGTDDGKSQAPEIDAVSDVKVPGKRPRSKSSDRTEKKKAKRMRGGASAGSTPSHQPDKPQPSPPTAPTSKMKTVKDILAKSNVLSSPPTMSQAPPSKAPTETMATTPPSLTTITASSTPAGSTGQTNKKSVPKKRPEQTGGSLYSAATTNVTVSSLQKHGVQPDEHASGLASLRSSTPPPPTLYPDSLTNGGAGPSSTPIQDLSSEPLTNGPVLGPPRSRGTPSSSSSKTTPLMSPTRSAEAQGQLPTSMEQLLERQWDQGSHFLMEQAQHFDIASLLNCLHQLRQENQRLEEHIASLTARRDQLLAVNARLSLPLTPLANNPRPPSSNNQSGGAAGAGSSAGPSPEAGSSHSGRNPRVNNFIPPDAAAIQQDLREAFSQANTRSPAQSRESPAASQSGLPLPPLQSPGGSQANLPHRSSHPSPDTPTRPSNQSSSERGLGHPPPIPPPSSSSSSSSAVARPTPSDRHLGPEQQRLLLQQQQQLMLGSSLTPEQHQQLMLQMLHQHTAVAALANSQHLAAAAAAAAAHARGGGGPPSHSRPSPHLPPPPPPMMASSAGKAKPDKVKDKT